MSRCLNKPAHSDDVTQSSAYISTRWRYCKKKISLSVFWVSLTLNYYVFTKHAANIFEVLYELHILNDLQ